jgi:hypothetical protein
MKYGVIAQEIADVIPVDFEWKPITKPAISVSAPPESNITFYGGSSEILKITEDGFYVRGKKVDANEEEAEAVYRAFKQFLAHHALTRV